jgi:hypothetical protein
MVENENLYLTETAFEHFTKCVCFHNSYQMTPGSKVICLETYNSSASHEIEGRASWDVKTWRLIRKASKENLLGRLDPEDEGSTIRRNVCNYLSVGTA